MSMSYNYIAWLVLYCTRANIDYFHRNENNHLTSKAALSLIF